MDSLILKEISYLRARDPSILTYNGCSLSAIAVNLKPQMGEIKLLAKMAESSQEVIVLSDEEDSSSNCSIDISEIIDGDNLKVYLRIKGGIDFQGLYEISDDRALVCHVPPTAQIARHVCEGDHLSKRYDFSHIFDPRTSQVQIFNYIVKPRLLNFINGGNAVLLTYGISGSGKTHTMMGIPRDPGLVPRSLEYVFRTLPMISQDLTVKPLANGEVIKLDDIGCRTEKRACRTLLNSTIWSDEDKLEHIQTYLAMQETMSNEPFGELENQSDLSVGVWVSYAEIYNEQIFDLLQASPGRGQKRPILKLGFYKGRHYIKNLTSVPVFSGMDAYQVMQFGISNLNCTSTNVNKNSSRSHSIFTIKIVQSSKGDGGAYVCTFNFCDLAGAERSKKTLNVGDRLKESNNINSSLMVLGKCITGIRNAQKVKDNNRVIPFRESKLTLLFQKALSGEEHICMIVNINPTIDMFDETQHVLNFSAIASEIAIDHNKAALLKPKKDNRFSRLLTNQQTIEEIEAEQLEEILLEKDALIAHLRDAFVRQKNDYEFEMHRTKEHFKSSYGELIADLKETYRQQLEKMEERERVEYSKKLKKMMMEYERRANRDKVETIILDSSDDEDKENHNTMNNVIEDNNKVLTTEISELKIVISKLKRENLELQATTSNQRQRIEILESLETTNSDLAKEIDELKKIIQDAKVAYLELQENANKYKLDYYKSQDIADEKTLQLELSTIYYDSSDES